MTLAIKFCGGAGTVTGSMHYVTTGHTHIVLDCGLFFGHRDAYYEVNSHFSFNPHQLDACILSHAHIDHSGNIPTLVKKGFRSSVLCTPTTRDLCHYMLPDSGYVQEEDIKYVNKINKRRGLPSRQPLYTKEDAQKVLKYFRALDYHTSFSLHDMEVTFYEAGHILGSAIPVVEVKGTRGVVRIAYAVDLGRMHMPLLRDPEIPEDIDYLVLESTYGARVHTTIDEAEQKFADAINRTVKRGGKIIIPSFALERTQFMVYFINELIKKNMIKKLPIYVDGPLASHVTQVFRDNAAYFDEATSQLFQEHKDPFRQEHVTYIEDIEASKRLHQIDHPVIILSASGMCENGRILHHLKNNIENPHNTVIIVGYMAENTLGRRIADRSATVRIFGRLYERGAEVVMINAFSSHADSHGLVDYCRKIKTKKLKKIFLVHGDPNALEALRQHLRTQLNIKAHVPTKDEVMYLKG